MNESAAFHFFKGSSYVLLNGDYLMIPYWIHTTYAHTFFMFATLALGIQVIW